MTLTWARLSENMNTLVTERDSEWSGIPMPIERHTLVVEDKNPWKDRLALLEQQMFQTPTWIDDDTRVVNTWYSPRLRANVVIAQKVDGTYFSCVTGHDFDVKQTAAIGTIAASEVWSVDAELTAQTALSRLVKPHLFRMYLLTGMILETSQRSRVTYVFRRSRPTLALRPRGEAMAMLCALCLHPIGYYKNTFAGSMVPTDEVIAHLLLMRGDEPMYWRRSNQHSIESPLAGV